MKRALRRYHSARMKAKAKRYFRQQEQRMDSTYPKEWEDRAARFADHLKSCSCWMCGNPRHYYKGNEKLTVQEILANIRDKDEK